MLNLIALLVGQTAPVEMTDAQSLEHLLQGLGGLKGAGALGIATLVTQLFMFLSKTPMADWLGKWKLLAVTGVALLSTVLAGKASGQTWVACLLSAPVVAALQVFGHQLLSQFSAAKGS